jgi:hypothetical protein
VTTGAEGRNKLVGESSKSARDVCEVKTKKRTAIKCGKNWRNLLKLETKRLTTIELFTNIPC